MPKELPKIAIGLDERLSYARKEAGYNRCEVSAHFGIPTSLVRDWEYGEATPADERLEQLAKFYDVRYEWLKSGAPANR